MAFYYSVKAFEDAGLNENDVPKTWDQLIEVANKLTTADRYGVLFETTPGYYQNFTWYPFMWQGGGEFQGADGKSAFDSPAVVAGAEALAGCGQFRCRTAAGERRRLGHRRQPRLPATAPCRTSASGASRRWRTTPPTSPTASSSCRFRPAASM